MPDGWDELADGSDVVSMGSPLLPDDILRVLSPGQQSVAEELRRAIEVGSERIAAKLDDLGLRTATTRESMEKLVRMMGAEEVIDEFSFPVLLVGEAVFDAFFRKVIMRMKWKGKGNAKITPDTFIIERRGEDIVIREADKDKSDWWAPTGILVAEYAARKASDLPEMEAGSFPVTLLMRMLVMLFIDIESAKEFKFQAVHVG